MKNPLSSQPRPPSMQDVARTANVSTATVSRVLNNPALVAPETAQRVQRAIAELSYKPNVFAQGLMTRRSRLLSIAIPDLHSEFYAAAIRAAGAEAARAGYQLAVNGAMAEDPGAPNAGANSGLIGGMVVMMSPATEPAFTRAREADLPVVVIDCAVRDPDLDYVVVDIETGTIEATRHLLSALPPLRCFYVGDPRECHTVPLRAAAFVRTLAEAGWSGGQANVLLGDRSGGFDQRALRTVFDAAASGPVGVVTGHDEIAAAFSQEAERRRIPVPGGLRIVGFGDCPSAARSTPALTSLCLPMDRVGQTAVRLLIDRLEHPDTPPRHERLRCELRVRESAGPATPRPASAA